MTRYSDAELERRAVALWSAWSGTRDQAERARIGRELTAVVRKLVPLDDIALPSGAIGGSW